jgi:hypothetical protein
MHKTLTMVDLCGPLLNGRHLVFDRDQLLLEGLLGLLGACNDSRSKAQTTTTHEVHGVNLRRPWKFTIYHDLDVGSRILRLPFGGLQFLLQVGHLFLRLVRHGLLDPLNLLRVFDLGLELRLAGRGGLCVGVGRFPQ